MIARLLVVTPLSKYSPIRWPGTRPASRGRPGRRPPRRGSRPGPPCGRRPSRRPTSRRRRRLAAEPAVERGVHRHVEVGGDGELAAAARTASVFSLGQTKIRATISRSAPAGGLAHDAATVGTSVGRQPVDDRAVGLAAGQAQHALAQRGDEDRRRLLGADAEAEALHLERVVAAARPSPRVSAVAQEAHHVADLLVRLDERHAVPALDDHVAATTRCRCANRPGRGVGQRRALWARQRRRPRVGGHDRRPQAQPGLPRRGQRERRERVGAVGLRRPDVGVAEVGQLGQTVTVGVQRARQRHRHPGSHGKTHRTTPW